MRTGMTEQADMTVPIHRPKSREKLFFLLSGIIVSVPLSAFIYTFSDYVLPFLPAASAGLFSSVLLAPFVEEFSKAYPLFFRHGETERSIFTLGFLVGCGFGLAEFAEYVILFNAPILLRLPGILFHASSTSIVAFGISRKTVFPFYMVAVVLHMLNNVFAAPQLWPLYVFAGPLVIGLTYYLSWFYYGKTRERMIPL
jgi:RsiW-degrading membrane proteinase PrsW (M82 family)